MDSMSADVAEDSKEASTETMEVAVSEEDLEDTMVARSRPRKLNDPSENSSKTSKKRGEQIRQAVRRHRLEMSEEKKNEKREKDRIYVAKKRELKRMEEEKKGIIRKGPKKKEEGYLWNEQEKNRDYKRKKRANRTEEEIEFDRIENVLAVRKHRASRTGKQCLLDRMKQQQSSRDFNEFGRLRPYKERLNGKRSMKNRDEHVMWQKYINTRKENLNLLGEKKPEIVSKVRKKEKEDLEKYEEKGRPRKKKRRKDGRKVIGITKVTSMTTFGLEKVLSHRILMHMKWNSQTHTQRTTLIGRSGKRMRRSCLKKKPGIMRKLTRNGREKIKKEKGQGMQKLVRNITGRK